MQIYRRYRDKEPTTAPVTTTPRATTPSEIKKSTINVTVNPKSLTTNTVPNAATKTIKVSKKIDMGAATNFGRDEIGINSPTHRNTHAEEDLFATSNTINTSSTTSNSNKTDLLDDIFKTCSATTNPMSNTVLTQSNNDDDFFNPREDESQEFGDFASAFGTSTETTATTIPSAVTVTPVTVQPAEEMFENNGSPKNEFADFSAAFTGTNHPTSNPTDPTNLLFAISTTPNAQQTTSNSNQKVGDLLSDLDGLSLNVSVPTGKFFCPQ